MPQLEAHLLRAVSLSLAKGTASTVDGFHVRHYSLLSDAALAVLATILLLVEALGYMPTQVAFVVVVLLDKPTGLFRPIGIFASIYRLWMKARRSWCLSWEVAHDAPFFDMASGREVVDLVGRQAVRQEASVAEGSAEGSEAATLYWDLVK